MMFLEAKALIDKPKVVYSGVEYNGTSVSDVVNKIKKYGGPGDAYLVEYRELLASGNVKKSVGLANYGWITRIGFGPGVEITRLEPTAATAARWAIIYQDAP